MSAAVMPLDYAIKQGFINGFTSLITSSSEAAAALRKGRHSERAILIRLRRIDALTVATSIQVLPICMPTAPMVTTLKISSKKM